MPCVILAISVAQREGIIVMSKLSFVALSLQTTHLDPASVSKVSYVKLVDGNITRQDDVPIIPPTSKKKVADEEAELSLTSWDDALEKLGMMIGKLPIVSYYRDADKEIFHAASGYLNVDPLRLHWLDCRELARHLLPDLPDVQLSTVLKTLDLFDDYADSSAVEQTAQIVIALAQRQGATTVAELWGELYDHPEDFLGLDSTFEGAAESGSSTHDDEVIDAPSAAEVLPFAATAGALSHAQSEEKPTSDEDGLPEEPSGEHIDDEPIPTQDDYPVQESDEAFETTEAHGDSLDEQPAADIDIAQPLVAPPVTDAEELPVFLQEPTQDEQADRQPEPTQIDETPEHAPELATAAASIDAPDHDGEDSAEAVDLGLDQDAHSVEAPETDDDIFQAAVQKSRTSKTDLPPLRLDTSSEPLAQVDEAALADSENDHALEPRDAAGQPAFLKESSSDEHEAHDVDAEETEQAEHAAAVPDEGPSERSQEPPASAEPQETVASVISPAPLVAPPVSIRAEASDASVLETHTVQAIKVSERPRVEEPTARTSNTNRIFGFVGLFLFGVLTIIGVVLVVMAVMLFFTENSLMLETKIAGVILTVAIALLSLLMTNVSYRSFRKK